MVGTKGDMTQCRNQWSSWTQKFSSSVSFLKLLFCLQSSLFLVLFFSLEQVALWCGNQTRARWCKVDGCTNWNRNCFCCACVRTRISSHSNVSTNFGLSNYLSRLHTSRGSELVIKPLKILENLHLVRNDIHQQNWIIVWIEDKKFTFHCFVLLLSSKYFYFVDLGTADADKSLVYWETITAGE